VGQHIEAQGNTVVLLQNRDTYGRVAAIKQMSEATFHDGGVETTGFVSACHETQW